MPRIRRPRLGLQRDSATLIGLVVIGAYLIMLVASFVLPESAALRVDSRHILEWPSFAHPMGTDQIGRDQLARIVIGARTAAVIVLPGAFAAMLIGSVVGLISGYASGPIDSLLMRIVDIGFAFPPVLLALALVAGMGPGPTQLSVALAVVYAPMFVRVTRGPLLEIRQREFVAASIIAGAGARWVIRRHALPNVLPYIIVQTTLTLAWSLLTVASLSFLGLGVQPPTAEWGALLNEGRQWLTLNPWLSFFPGIAIVLVVVGLNLLGDSLRSGLDQRFVPQTEGATRAQATEAERAAA